MHPIHIVSKDNRISPSAFIPFCEFGGNMSSVGVKINQFEWPVCNCFRAKILNDQLCYEVDLSRFSDKDSIERELKLGFNFIMDYNEDRQITFDSVTQQQKDQGLASSIIQSDEDRHAFIRLNTIGKSIKLQYKNQSKKFFR